MSDAVETVQALWVGYPGEAPDRSVLTPGETVREIPRAEAEASDYWRVVEDKPDAVSTVAAAAKQKKGNG